MTTSDPIADSLQEFVTQILQKHDTVDIPASKIKSSNRWNPCR